MHPKLIICMGVSGSGKSTLAKFMAKKLGVRFLEADDYHPEQNIEKMKSGVPLTDVDREPWITALCRLIYSSEETIILAYSGLRMSHRERFRELNKPSLFLKLDISPDVATARLTQRVDHFMPDNLVESQFAAMEDQGVGEHIEVLDGTIPFDQLKLVALEHASIFLANSRDDIEGMK